jgi:hypothetical protein
LTVLDETREKINKKFRAIGFFNEADTLETSSILIYSKLRAVLYTQSIAMDAVLIKH